MLVHLFNEPGSHFYIDRDKDISECYKVLDSTINANGNICKATQLFFEKREGYLSISRLPHTQNPYPNDWNPGGGGEMGARVYLPYMCRPYAFKSWSYFRPKKIIFYTLFETKLQKSIL